jgi:cell wall-associated NlpC family hydrolase
VNISRSTDPSVLLIIVAVLLVMSGCAAKQVRIYETGPGVRDDIVRNAMGVLGKPYKIGAKGPDAFDCSGLVHFAYRQANIAVPPMTEAQIKLGTEVSRNKVLPGDLVFFKIKKDLHAGIMLNKRDFIHASKSKGVSVDDINTKYWGSNLIGFRVVCDD